MDALIFFAACLAWMFAMTVTLVPALGNWVYFRVLGIKEWVDYKLLCEKE